jgi:hypothetical protein
MHKNETCHEPPRWFIPGNENTRFQRSFGFSHLHCIFGRCQFGGKSMKHNLLLDPTGPRADRERPYPMHKNAQMPKPEDRSPNEASFGVECKKTTPRTNWTIMSMASRISRKESEGSLKGKDGLAEGFGGNWFLEPFCRGKVHGYPQHLREEVLNGDHVQKRQTPSRSELGYHVHIRHLADSRPPGVRAVQEQMLDASGFQLAFVFPQFGYDGGLVHAAILFSILPHLKQPGIVSPKSLLPGPRVSDGIPIDATRNVRGGFEGCQEASG